MKTLLCGLLTVVALHGASAATAYEALRVVGKAKGDPVLDRVIEVRASKGAPHPRTWKVAVLDDRANGGAREYDVQGTSLSGERPAQAAGAGTPMNMNQLNLDSDGAHTVAEREARKAGFAYDYVNYILRGGPAAASPVWELRLVDDQNGNTAVLTLAADTGKLLAAEGLNKGSAPVPKIVENRRRPAPEDAVAMSEEEEEELARMEERRRIEERRRRDREEDEEEHDEVDKPGNKVTRFFDRAGRHIGGAFQKFGNKLDRTFGNPPPRRVQPRRSSPPSRVTRDANGTEYYRPRD